MRMRGTQLVIEEARAHVNQRTEEEDQLSMRVKCVDFVRM